MDEEMFQREFECVPAVTGLTPRILQDEFRKIHEELTDPVKDWRLRVGAAKQIRSLLIAGAADYPDFDNQLQMLDNCFKLGLQDLRSQVVREICITIMYCSTQLGARFDHMAEALLPSLMSLVSNSAKIMSTSAIVSVYSIIRNSRSARLVPLITCHLSSKSQSIRRESLGFLEVILHTWPTESLVKHSTALKSALTRGITDADAKARKHARKAFVGFMQHFKTEGDGLMVLLDRRMQKLLHSEMKQCQTQHMGRHESGESVSTSNDIDDDVSSSVSKIRTKALNFYSGKFASESGDNLDNYTPEETRVPKEKVEPEEEHTDVVKQVAKAKRAKSVPPMPRRPTVPSPPDTRTSTVTEEDLFLQQCEDVPQVRIASARDLARRMTLIRSTLSDCTCPWEKRVEAAQNIRALLMANAAESIDFYVLLRKLEIALQLALKDTHLAVMRETSITVCFLAMRLGWRFEHCAEILLPTIVSLQLSPIKDVAMASTVTFRVIIQNTQSEKLIPIIVSNFASKYTLVRRENYKAMAEVIGNWPFNAIVGQLPLIEESLTSGINDPDPTVRAEARSAFYLFTGKYAQTKTQTSRSRQAAHHRCLDGVAEDLDGADSVCSNHSSESAHKAAGWERERPGASARSVHSHNYPPSTKTGSYNNAEYSDSYPNRYQKAANVDDSIDHLEDDSVCRRTTLPRQRQLSPSSGRRQQGIEEPRNWDCQDKSPPSSYESAASTKGNPRVVQHTFRSRPRSSIPVAQTLRCMRARSFTGEHPRLLSPVLEEDSKEKEKSTRASIDTDDVSVAVQICHSDNCITWPETLEQTPLHKTKSDEKCIDMDDIYPDTRSPTHTPRNPNHSPTPLTSSPIHSPRTLSCSSPPHLTDSTSDSFPTPLIPPSPHTCLNLQRNETLEPTPLHKTLSDEKCTDIEDNYNRTANPTQAPCSPANNLIHGQHTRSCHTRQRNEPLEMERVTIGSTKPSQYVYNETLRRDMMQMMSMLNSSSLSDRQEGLLLLQNQLSCNRAFNRLELSKLTEVFTLMFHDHNERVYSLLVDTLGLLVEKHYLDLGGWLYMCLTRLLTKLCTDMMLGPLKSRVEKTLNTVKSHFAYGDQFKVLLRFIVELEMQNFKLIIVVLHYISDIIQAMTGQEFCNTSDMRLATSRIIRWVSEPGSVEIRKMAMDVLCSMYQMNNDEFIVMLCELPRAFQESAVKMLHVEQSTLDRLGCVPLQRLMARRRRPHNRHTERTEASNLGSRPMSECTTMEDAMSIDSYAMYAESEDMTNASKVYHPGMGHDMGDGSFDNEDAFYEQYVAHPPKLLELIADLSVHERSDQVRLRLRDGLVKLSQNCISDDTYLPSIFTHLLQSLDDVEDKTRMLTLQAMTELQRQPHCAGAISSLSEYAHDIIEKVLQLHLDGNLRVKTAAEDCASMLVRSLPPNRLIQVLIPIVERSQNTVQLAAVNMMSETIKRMSEDDVTAVMAKVIPGLLKGYDSVVGNVRKACVYCLVALHEAVGETVLQPYLSQVSETKRKLLNVYIKRGT